jgi:hypothetical protein
MKTACVAFLSNAELAREAPTSARSLWFTPGGKFMGDVLASKGERDRSHIAMDDEADVRRWLKHLGVTKPELRHAVDKVGNSVAAVRKQLGLETESSQQRS